MIERCFPLNHPNVVQLFSASHLSSPFLAVFEDVSSTSLREYLAREENKHLLWQKVFEVALGLQYLVESGIIVETLRCSDIWVTKDGIAKINAFSCFIAQHKMENVRWQSPGMIRDEVPSIASNVYSLAMCVAKALTGEVLWGSDIGLESFKVLGGLRPELPGGVTRTQRNFFSRLWLADPSQRPTMASVVPKSRQLANEQNSRYNFKGSITSVQQQNQSFDIERFIFPELESTIAGFLEKLS